MASKFFIGIVTLVVASSLLIYASFDNKSTSGSPIAASSLVPSPTPRSDVAPVVPSAQQENLFQKRLDEQRMHPSKPTESSTSKYPPGHDPFKAFVNTQKQQMEKAYVSPFEKR